MKLKDLPVKVKAGPEDGLEEGEFVAYASVFGNRDSYGDVVVKGAFAKTLEEWSGSGNAIPLLFGHRFDDPDYNIGSIKSAEEDERGLKVTAQIDLDSPKGAQTYRLLKGRRISQMSFAYDVLDAEHKDGDYLLKELKLFEVSVVPIGANQETEILAVKAAALAATEGVKAGRSLSAKNETALRDAAQAIQDVLDSLPSENNDQSKASEPPESPESVASETPEGDSSVATSQTQDAPSSVKSLAATLDIDALEGQKGAVPMSLIEQRAAKLKAAQDIIAHAKAEGRATDLKSDEIADVQKLRDEIKALDEKIAAAKESAALIAELAGADNSSHEEDQRAQQEPAKSGTIGERFVKSAGMVQIRERFSPQALRDTKNPFEIEAKGLADLSDLGIGLKADLTTVTGQPTPNRLPGYRNELLDEPFTFLSLVSTGTTDSSWLEYAQIIDETDNAAIVPEGELKPLSDVETAKAEAKAHVYADGFNVTNQLLADDGAIATFMESRIKQHVQNRVEDVLINGDATANVKGILSTSGVQAQAFDTDVVTTLAAALQKVEKVQATPQAIVMNPVDAWKLSLLKENGVGYLMGNPLAQGLMPTPFGVPLVKSNRVAAGTALVGNFSSIQLLQREALSVVAFNQHKDFAQRNMSYVRAELRAMQLFYAPRELVVTKVA